MQGHLTLMTGASSDLSWKRWNSFTIVSAVIGIWEESLEEKVSEVVQSGCPLSMGVNTGFLSFPSGSLICITCDQSVPAAVVCVSAQNGLPGGLM